MADLTNLARELGLNERQRRFVEALAADPDRHQTNAAIAAGYAKRSAHVRAAELVKLRKVQEYLGALTKAAVSRSQGKSIASLEEALAFQTTVMRRVGRARLGDFLDEDGGIVVAKVKAARPGVVRKYESIVTTLEEGQVVERRKLSLEPLTTAAAASRTLIEHHTGMSGAPGADRANVRVLILNVLTSGRDSREMLDQLARRALAAAVENGEAT